MAKKGNRVQVILECIEQKESGLPGMSRYITTKNKKKNQKQENQKQKTLKRKMMSGEK